MSVLDTTPGTAPGPVSGMAAPGPPGTDHEWSTPAGVRVRRRRVPLGGAGPVRARLTAALDERRGMLAFQDAHRVIGYTDPPVEVAVRGQHLTVRALNERGLLLLPVLRRALAGVLTGTRDAIGVFTGRVPASAEGDAARPAAGFTEEERTRHAGVFAAVRALTAAFAAADDPLLGLYGAFGYDLVFQLEPVRPSQRRDPDDRDLVLHLPDEIVELDLRRDEAVAHRYVFTTVLGSTEGLSGATESESCVPGFSAEPRDHPPGEYAALVASAMPEFRAGRLFEVVPGQVFRRPVARRPSELFRRLYEQNPAPYSLLMNLGDGEHLVGASPETFVTVRRETAAAGDRLVVESSPISGTAKRGRDALEDAARIKELLGSVKEESELTMCTDVDRNDKSRVCLPGTVEVTARRTIEMYSTLIHTVDRVRGVLRPDRDALDAFLTHLWAVTVTGAPKAAAIEFIERSERSPRRWYGGAAGRICFDGSLHTVLTLRTIQLRRGVATVRAGATLLHDSSPAAEEAETELKAKALLRVLEEEPPVSAAEPEPVRTGAGARVLLVDHRDSFVHSLADLFRQTGAEVVTYRSGRHLEALERERPDLVVLSPGPGRPDDFDVAGTIAACGQLGLPVFGVCLGLQGLVEFAGGSLGVLGSPVHGKASRVRVTDPASRLLRGLPPVFDVGRYHSLHARPESLPPELAVTAVTEDGVVMAVEHRTRPLAAVQFHPESIMTSRSGAGRRVISNAVALLARSGPAPLAPGPAGPRTSVLALSGAVR